MDAQSTLFDRKRKRDDTDHRTKKKRRRTREKQRKARENEAESSTKPALHNDSAHGSMPQTVNKDKIVGSDSSVRLATEKKEEQSSGREKKRRRKSKPTAPGLPALSSHVDEASKDGSTQDTFNAADEADAPRAGKQRKKRRRKNPLRSLVKDEHGQTPELNGVSSSVQALSSNVQDIQRSSEIGKVEATEDSKKSKRKKKRKGSVTSSIDPLSGAEVDLVDIKHRKEVSNELPPHTSAWTVINPTAGRMLEQAACFSSDERQLMFAAESCAFVGSIDSSTIIHTTQPFGTTQLSAYSIIDSTSRGQQCAVLGFSDGNLAIWNPRKGKNDHLGRTRKQSVCALATTARLGDHAESLIFWVTRRTKSSEIFVRSPHMESNPTRILKRRATVQSLKCSRSGRILIATTSDSILVGALKNSVDVSAISSASFEYDWEEIRCKLPPNCFDFRIAEATNARIETILETDRIPEVNVHDRLDIAFGGLDGCIYVYDSILGNLGIIDGRQQPLKRTQLSPREMHWHREAVGALAFSPDGNYLVSGGQETVLVLWQLDTGTKTFLPHLESPVRSISISSSGSMYAVGTADNSTMVLSTTELKPIANFVSLQSPSTATLIDQRLILPTKETVSAFLSGAAATSLACAANPVHPSHLLLAAPSHQSANTSIFPNTPPSPYLQTYDIARNLHISRQPLTRTNATSTNLAPQGNKLQEPNITHLSVSSNGQWLATIDEWRPPAEDIKTFTQVPIDSAAETAKQIEVNLQIWRWNERDQNWMLNTRLPSPHESLPSDRTGVARTLALEASPFESAFATVGEDRTVRVWTPRMARRDGKVIRGDSIDTTTPAWWALQHTIPLEGKTSEEPLGPLGPNDAKLAWSGDGSLIAAWLGFPIVPSQQRSLSTIKESQEDGEEVDVYDSMEDSAAQDVVHFIDADAGTLRDSRADMLTTSDRRIQGLAFADRYLLLLSRVAVRIWDLPHFTHLPTIQIPASTAHAPSPHFAVNHTTNTFAITVAVSKRPEQDSGKPQDLPPHAHRDFTSRVLVYPLPRLHPAEKDNHAQDVKIAPVLDSRLPHLALALLSAGGNMAPSDPFTNTNQKANETDTNASLRKGYIVVDSNANIRRLEPPLLSETLAKAIADEQADAGAMDIDHGAPVEQPLAIFSRRDVVRRSSKSGGEAAPSRRQQPRVVPSQKLAEAIGQGPILRDGVNEGRGQAVGGGLPSVREMFDRVVGLFWGRGDDGQDE